MLALRFFTRGLVLLNQAAVPTATMLAELIQSGYLSYLSSQNTV